MRRMSVFGLAACLALAGLSLATAGSRSSETTGVIRFERTFVNPWHFGCHLDACQGGPSPFAPIEVAGPASGDPMDVVVTMTMDYRTTAGDYGLVKLRLDPPREPAFVMKPGGFRLSSGGERTTTSMSWVARNVPTSGGDLELRLLVLPRMATSDGLFHIAGKRFTVVVEMWSVG